MNKKSIYIVVAVLIVVIVVGVAGVLLLGNNNGGNNNATPTPTAAPSVVGANTLQFSVNDTTTATKAVVSYQFACKNFNTSTEILKVDMNLGADGNFSYILNAGEMKSWISMDNGATWTASDYTTDYTNYGVLFINFVDKLAAQGNTNDLTYTTDTSSITIFCIAVNEAIPDSTFSTS